MTHIKSTLVQTFKRYKTSRLVIAFILFWTPIIIFAKLAGEIIEREPIGFDIAILNWIHAQSTPFLDGLFLVFTTVGNAEFFIPITIAILAFLIYKKQRLNTLILIFGVGGAAVANLTLKFMFHRDRPSLWSPIITETSYSFPSGHAMMSSALIFCLIVLLWNTKWRLMAVIVGAVIGVMIGASRLYLGVHYPTDVIAGWSVSLAWVLIVTIIAKELSYKYRNKLQK